MFTKREAENIRIIQDSEAGKIIGRVSADGVQHSMVVTYFTSLAGEPMTRPMIRNAGYQAEHAKSSVRAFLLARAGRTCLAEDSLGDYDLVCFGDGGSAGNQNSF